MKKFFVFISDLSLATLLEKFEDLLHLRTSLKQKQFVCPLANDRSSIEICPISIDFHWPERSFNLEMIKSSGDESFVHLN